MDKFNSFYFVGMGGVSMSALAGYLRSLKKRVGGSDINAASLSKLKSLGIFVTNGNGRDILGYDAVVYTDAVSRDNAELRLARAAGKPIIPRGKLLAEVCKKFKRVIAVSGCHGKTTCTSMLASVFSSAGRAFAAHIGGNSVQFGNFCNFGNDFFITEACEYKKNFLSLHPDTAVILSTDADHLECYGGAEELKKCYSKFAARAQKAVVPFGDDVFRDIEGTVTFGYAKGADWQACELREFRGVYSFTLYFCGAPAFDVKLKQPGAHNVLNALAAAAAAATEGIEFAHIKRGLEEFEGVERRMQLLGSYRGARYVADYAHHPAEIAAALKTAERITEGRLFVVFQPHTYSRTKNLYAQFVSVLSGVRRLLIYRTFAAREYFDGEGCALTLSQSVKRSRYGDCPGDILNFVSSAGEGDTVLFLGAGDIYFIAKTLLCALEKSNAER
ncbi:MAG TPA: hypothetical protein IAB69_00875 [Candidatus Coproplasma excrementigallinarum]|uniref:UDP-N-acetylmuramate--L-alanine ligase n=1 Tax=Candidatus Coproplasma excrementigallinarum TaxID=2840747 RepID=A0A9D1SI09_9FIRM|nr:hypothetical protein [Candidatus Coproplasma excrementigallinarum]